MSSKLLEILRENNISLIPSSQERWVASCPFHEGDSSPSFTVYPTGTYFCFGCEAWGDAVKFLVDYKKMSHAEAQDYVGVQFRERVPKKVIKVRSTAASYKFLYDVAWQYHDFLKKMPGAGEYLKSRGLADETIDRYMIGYTDGNVLAFRYAEEFNMAEECGFFNKHRYEIFSHRITIPNLVGEKACDFIVGRTVVNDKIKYLGTKTPKPIFGLYELRTSPILFLVEGQFDYLLLRQWGYPAVVVGGAHISNLNLAVLKHRKIIVLPDNDDVGAKAAIKIQKQLPDVEVVDYSILGVKDISELAGVKNGQALFSNVIWSQEWISSLSLKILDRWFPSSLGMTHSPSTLKLQDSIR